MTNWQLLSSILDHMEDAELQELNVKITDTNKNGLKVFVTGITNEGIVKNLNLTIELGAKSKK